VTLAAVFCRMSGSSERVAPVFRALNEHLRHGQSQRHLCIQPRSLLRTGCLYLSVTTLPLWAQTPNMPIRFDPTTPAAGTSVIFDPDDAGMLPSNALSGLPIKTMATQDGKFLLIVDSQSYHRDKYHRFTFDCYFKRFSDKSTTPIHKFVVVEEPIGTFPDLVGPVTVHISDGNETDAAVIELPQHSDDPANLTVAIPSSPYPVPMGNPSRMELGVSNNLASLHVNIDPTISVVATKCPRCWEQITAKVIHEQLGFKQGTSLIVELHPNSFEAFKQNLLVFDSNAPQDELVGTITSEADDGGLAAPQDFHIPVRYSPPIGFLFLSIVCGAFIGCAIRFSISILTPPKISLLETGVAAITAVVAWLLVLLLFATKTKVTVLGYDLDPTQVVSAGLVTLIAAGGAPFARRLTELFKG